MSCATASTRTCDAPAVQAPACGAPLQAVLLAGGRGMRLQALVSDRPKPMAPVAGRPFIEWLVRMLHAQGIEHLLLCISHLGQHVRDHFGDGSDLGVEIAYSEDPELLGTGGALRRGLPLLRSDPVLVLNGDSYCEANLPAFLAWHRAHVADGSLLLTLVDDPSRYGRVSIGTGGRIVHFEEKHAMRGPGWINAGVYLLSRRFVASIPVDAPVSLERQIFPRWVGHRLYGYAGGGRFVDIGTPESYAEAGRFFVSC